MIYYFCSFVEPEAFFERDRLYRYFGHTSHIEVVGVGYNLQQDIGMVCCRKELGSFGDKIVGVFVEHYWDSWVFELGYIGLEDIDLGVGVDSWIFEVVEDIVDFDIGHLEIEDIGDIGFELEVVRGTGHLDFGLEGMKDIGRLDFGFEVGKDIVDLDFESFGLGVENFARGVELGV